ncbi:hypothetical protein BGZ46_004436 [Entomortierella lignicola]|nr:hypothetical protein BGZ46_004436 [Entomortierella lignicola]
MDRDNTSEKSTQQRTPKTPTNPRIKSSVGRASPYATIPSSPTSRISSRSNTGTPTLPLKDESNSTTPVYPDSTTLVNSNTSNEKLHLSDMQPVDPKVLERIKNLEISIKQHRDTEIQKTKNIKTTRQEYINAKEKHNLVMQSGNSQLEQIRSDYQVLQDQSFLYSGIQQGLWPKLEKLQGKLDANENQVLEIRQEYLTGKAHRDKILKEREETNAVKKEDLERKITMYQAECESSLDTTEQVLKELEGIKKLGDSEEIERLRRKIREKDEMILKLKVAKAQFRSASMVEEKNADELINLFEMVYARRTRSHKEEFDAILRKAKDEESKRAIEVEEAFLEKSTLEPLLKEIEDKTVHEEFKLMIEKEEQKKLEDELRSLKLELQA